jgi:hypothetical protein
VPVRNYNLIPDILIVQVNKLTREKVESGLTFAGFLVFHCPLKKDAVETLRMLADASHRVGRLDYIKSSLLIIVGSAS